MSQETFKTPKVKKMQTKRDQDAWSPVRKKKIKNRFLTFCDIVLEYTQYENMKQEELRSHSTSPLDSGGSTAESIMSDSLSSYNTEDDNSRSCIPSRFLTSPDVDQVATHRVSHDGTVDDSLESITCFCRKPFAGRPMIECNKCLTWIHLSCAKIRRNNIPEEFTCQKCREIRSKKRKSNRMRMDKLATTTTNRIVAAMS